MGVVRTNVGGTWQDVMAVEKGEKGDPGTNGAPGTNGVGVPVGGAAGQVLSKINSTNYNTEWVTVSGGGGGAPTGAAGGALSGTYPNPGLAATIAGAGIGISANVLAITAGTGITVGTDNVSLSTRGANSIMGNNTGSAATPIDLTATQATAMLNTFSLTLKGLVPPPTGSATGRHLSDDGTWVLPPSGGTGGVFAFTYSGTTTAPPSGAQIRFNNSTLASATTMWVVETDLDGLDVSLGLGRIQVGWQVYVQDFDNAANRIIYNVTGITGDLGTYWEFTVTAFSSAGTIPAGKVAFQYLSPGTIGLPTGGSTGQALRKTSGSNYAATWSNDPLTVSGTSKITVGTTEPTTPAVGDLWVDTT